VRSWSKGSVSRPALRCHCGGLNPDLILLHSVRGAQGTALAMSTIPPAWKAEFEGRTLHISGVVKYPNDFSTASLERVDSHVGSEVVSYRVVYHRDKEPFCGPDLIGPVHYYERNLPAGAACIRVTVGTKQVEFPIERI
jgi:hypothetical protein